MTNEVFKQTLEFKAKISALLGASGGIAVPVAVPI